MIQLEQNFLDFIFGFYTYRNKAFISKLDVLDHAVANGDQTPNIGWYFGDHVFDQYNWSAEPPQSITELYAQRARQLRDTYDYIILLYSGGSDSHEMLHTFLDNNIPIDEIQSIHPTSIVGNFLEGKNIGSTDPLSILAEHEYRVKPTFKWLSQVHPKIKLRIVDSGPTIAHSTDSWHTDNLNSSWLHTLTPLQFASAVTDSTNNNQSDKRKTCMIWGNNKPYIQITPDYSLVNGFTDSSRPHSAWIDSSGFKRNIYFEDFYWSIDAPLIPIKQSHLCLKKLQQEVDNKNVKSVLAIKNDATGNFREEWLKGVIYPHWDYGFFQSKKVITYTGYDNQDRNLYPFLPKIKSFNQEKLRFIKDRYKTIKNIDYAKPNLFFANSKKYKVGKLVF